MNRQRTWRPYLNDMLESCRRVGRYTAEMTLSKFVDHEMAYAATVQNLVIIGDSARQIPDEIRERLPAIEWKRLDGLRHDLVTNYPFVDDENVCSLIQTDVPELERTLQAFLDEQ